MTSMLAPRILIIDVDSGRDPAEVAKVAAALERQVLEHWAPAWGTMAAVLFNHAQEPGDIRIELRKVPTIDGALGFHSDQPDGTPIAYVFPDLCEQDGQDWSVCASHEILELLGNPFLAGAVVLPDGRVAVAEVCDQVEQDAYEIDGVKVSDWVTPANFEPPPDYQTAVGIKYDYLGLLKAPFEVRTGGYAQTYVPGQGYQQIGMMSRYRRFVAELKLSRGERRKGMLAP